MPKIAIVTVLFTTITEAQLRFELAGCYELDKKIKYEICSLLTKKYHIYLSKLISV
jgi:hypothetical protein